MRPNCFFKAPKHVSFTCFAWVAWVQGGISTKFHENNWRKLSMSVRTILSRVDQAIACPAIEGSMVTRSIEYPRC